MDRVGRVLKRGAAVVHAELAVGRRVPHVAVVAEDRVLDAHQVEDALDLAHVADGVAVEAADEVDLAVRLALELRHSAGLAVPEVLDDALHHVVVAGDMAADEGRRMREGNVEVRRDASPFPCAFLMKAFRSSPITSAMQVVETAIILGLYRL